MNDNTRLYVIGPRWLSADPHALRPPEIERSFRRAIIGAYVRREGGLTPAALQFISDFCRARAVEGQA